jgi:tetratricopeptide (TPR) repeat protein
MAVSGLVALLLFFVVWGLLHGSSDEAPWAAALVACVVLLIAASVRELFLRRTWARKINEFEARPRPDSFSGRVKQPAVSGSGQTARNPFNNGRSTWSHSAALRAVQKKSAESEALDTAEEHWEAYLLCQEYLDTTEEALRSVNLLAEKRVAMRGGQERVGALRKHHLKAWARVRSTAITQEAKHRARLHDKLDTARQALRVFEVALAEYPDDSELLQSERAVREFMAASKVSHWLEIAERTAFRGQHRRAIARYRDALFYVSREEMEDQAREDLATRIQREITALRAKIQNIHAFDDEEATPAPRSTSNSPREA